METALTAALLREERVSGARDRKRSGGDERPSLPTPLSPTAPIQAHGSWLQGGCRGRRANPMRSRGLPRSRGLGPTPTAQGNAASALPSRAPAAAIQTHGFGLQAGYRRLFRGSSGRLAAHDFPANHRWAHLDSNQGPLPCQAGLIGGPSWPKEAQHVTGSHKKCGHLQRKPGAGFPRRPYEAHRGPDIWVAE